MCTTHLTLRKIEWRSIFLEMFPPEELAFLKRHLDANFRRENMRTLHPVPISTNTYHILYTLRILILDAMIT